MHPNSKAYVPRLLRILLSAPHEEREAAFGSCVGNQTKPVRYPEATGIAVSAAVFGICRRVETEIPGSLPLDSRTATKQQIAVTEHRVKRGWHRTPLLMPN